MHQCCNFSYLSLCQTDWTAVSYSKLNEIADADQISSEIGPEASSEVQRDLAKLSRPSPDLPPTISRNFQFWVFERILHIFDHSRDLTQNGGMWGECSRFPPACPFIYWYYLSKAHPGSQFRPHNKFIGQKLMKMCTAQYEAILALFLAILPVPHENVRILVYIYVMSFVLIHKS